MFSVDMRLKFGVITDLSGSAKPDYGLVHGSETDENMRDSSDPVKFEIWLVVMMSEMGRKGQ